MQIQGFDSSADLLVPLGDSQVILGTVWLKSLGLTLGDFSRKTLCFWKEGKHITLQGVASKEVDVIEGRALIKILRVKGMAYVP